MPKQKKLPKVDEKDIWVELTQIGYGCGQAVAWRRGWGWPVGVVWFSVIGRKGGTVINIGNSYVPPAFQRQGVRTLIHEALLKQWPGSTFFTSDASSKEGMAWMKAMGYKNIGAGLMALTPKKR